MAGYNKHTITADVYPLAECSAGSVYLVDTPAVNAPQGTHIAETSLAVGGNTLPTVSLLDNSLTALLNM